ncbi:hypothetical protein [Brevibacterium aurantiacum]|uniref:hypothetical protein n=1 Tax=Brevibacterium aurantiacum TaxID=273384 RepID=UPI003F8DFDDD
MDYQGMRISAVPIHLMAAAGFVAGLVIVAKWNDLQSLGLVFMAIAFAAVVFVNLVGILLERIDERRRGVA